MSQRFKDRVIWITGASSGIGESLARVLSAQGAVLILSARRRERLEALAAALPGPALVIPLDLTDTPSLPAAVAEAKAWRGRIDILVNNAGIIRDNLLVRMGEDEWMDVINTNLNSMYHYCKAAVTHMMSARYGRIVNISSVAGRYGNPGQTNYAATKGGIDGFSRCLAYEMGKRKITVNSIAPGFIATDMTEAIRNAAGKEIKKQIAVRRLGEPEDIANATLFLASDEASYITGQVLTVDGGLTLGSGM